MSTIVLGCDTNNSNDSKFQNTVAKILTKQGHTVEKLSIGPTPFGSIGYKSKVKGKIGVYIMAASLTSVADLSSSGWQFKYTYFIIRGDIEGGRIKSTDDFNSKAIHKDPEGDCKAAACNRWNGKTYPEINKEIKSKGMVIFGGKTGEEIANSLVKAMGGDTSDSSSKSTSVSSIKEALTDVLYGWDGEAECYVRDDTVYIHKIPSPSDAKLSLIEGDNIDKDSVSVTDYNPSTVNILTTQFNDYELTIQDDHLIKRFGKISSSVAMDKEIKKLKDAKKFLQREWNKLKRDNGHVLELKTYGHSQWKVGEWCRVYLPSFNIDDYMYITKVSQDDSGEWNCNITLVDYPPGFGEPTKTDNDNENESKDTDSTEDSS